MGHERQGFATTGTADRREKRTVRCRIEPLEQRNLLSVGAAETDWFSQTPDADPLYKLGDMAAIYRAYEQTGNTADLGAELAGLPWTATACLSTCWSTDLAKSTCQAGSSWDGSSRSDVV